MRWRNVKQGKKQKKTEEKEEQNIPYASILDKTKAFLTDTFMITFPLIYIVIYFVMGDRQEFSENMAQGWLYIAIPHFVIVMLFWSIKGQTPGYKAYEIKLIDVSTMEKPSIVLLVLRYFIFLVSLLSMIGLIMAFFRKDRRSLHDLISGTCAVDVDKNTQR